MSAPNSNAAGLKAEALQLRRAGWSYTMIAAELRVSKSTLSRWLRAEPAGSALIEQRRQLGRARSGQTKRLRHAAAAEAQLAAGAAELQRKFAQGLTDRELFLVGLMLYWAEGRKTNGALELANADPIILTTFIVWLQKQLNVTVDRLRACIHVYPDVDVEEAERYWANVLNIPRTQFYRTHIDLRSDKSLHNRAKLPYGTAHIKVTGRGSADLHRTVLGWIAGFGEIVVK